MISANIPLFTNNLATNLLLAAIAYSRCIQGFKRSILSVNKVLKKITGRRCIEKFGFLEFI
jgi:hypothetical protein